MFKTPLRKPETADVTESSTSIVNVSGSTSAAPGGTDGGTGPTDSYPQDLVTLVIKLRLVLHKLGGTDLAFLFGKSDKDRSGSIDFAAFKIAFRMRWVHRGAWMRSLRIFEIDLPDTLTSRWRCSDGIPLCLSAARKSRSKSFPTQDLRNFSRW